MKYADIKKEIEKIAPPDLAEPWDNSGTQIAAEADVQKILVCLEITKEVMEEAEEGGYQMILAHHPLIFSPLPCIDAEADDAYLAKTAAMTARLIKDDISVYAAHTSFDSAPEGNNVYAMKLLGASDVLGPDEERMGSVGLLPEEITLTAFVEKVKDALGLPDGYIRYVGDPDAKVKRIALCTGAGASFMDRAIAEGCDALVTGDVKFDQAQTAAFHGLCLIDAGHFGTEKIFAENMKAQLEKLLPDVVIDESARCADPFHI